MSNSQNLDAIFDHIRADANKVEQAPGKLGGIWYAERWKLGDVEVQLQDDGYTRAVLTPLLRAYQTGGFEVVFCRGDAAVLAEVVRELGLV